MQKQRQKWHSDIAKLDERTRRERDGGREKEWIREAALILGGFLLSWCSFFWDSTLLVSLGFFERPTPRTLFGLSEFEWVLLNYNEKTEPWPRQTDQRKLQDWNPGLLCPGQCFARVTRPSACLLHSKLQGKDLFCLAALLCPAEARGTQARSYSLNGPTFQCFAPDCSQFGQSTDAQCSSSLRLEEKSVLRPLYITHLKNPWVPDSCMTSNHLSISFWKPLPERPQVVKVMPSAPLERSLENHWRRRIPDRPTYCSKTRTLVVLLLCAIRIEQTDILSKANCWGQERNRRKTGPLNMSMVFL